MSACANRIGIILAGGGSRRMGGGDKAIMKIDGVRMIDLVVKRLAPQVDEIIISGPDNYGTKFQLIPDRDDGPAGPGAALWAAAHWISEYYPAAEGFLSAPVDGPFFPNDLFARLSAPAACAITQTNDRLHPTFGFWQCDAVLNALSSCSAGEGVALHDLAVKVSAAHVRFDNAAAFFNINTREDLAQAATMLRP